MREGVGRYERQGWQERQVAQVWAAWPATQGQRQWGVGSFAGLTNVDLLELGLGSKPGKGTGLGLA